MSISDKGQHLIDSAIMGNLHDINYFISVAVPLNEQDELGNTALTHAAINEDIKIIHALLDAGADKDIKNHNGETALMSALKNNTSDKSIDILALFLSYNTDLNKKNNYGESLQDIVTNHKEPRLFQILQHETLQEQLISSCRYNNETLADTKSHNTKERTIEKTIEPQIKTRIIVKKYIKNHLNK